MINFAKTGIPGFGSATSNIGRGNQQQGLNLPWGGQQQQPTQMGYQQGRAPTGRPTRGVRPAHMPPGPTPTQPPAPPSAPTQAPTPQPTPAPQTPVQQPAPSQAITSTISPSVSSSIANTFNPNITFNPTFNPSLTLGPRWDIGGIMGGMGGGGGFTPWSGAGYNPWTMGGTTSTYQAPTQQYSFMSQQPWGGGGGFSPWQAGGQQSQLQRQGALAPGTQPGTPDYFLNPALQGGQPGGDLWTRSSNDLFNNLPPWQPGMPLRM